MESRSGFFSWLSLYNSCQWLVGKFGDSYFVDQKKGWDMKLVPEDHLEWGRGIVGALLVDCFFFFFVLVDFGCLVGGTTSNS